MGGRAINYTFVGASVERSPVAATSPAYLRVLVRTPAGNFRRISLAVDVNTARHLRGVLVGVCAQFKTHVAALWNAL